MAARKKSVDELPRVRVTVAQRRSLSVPVSVGQRREGDQLVDVMQHKTFGPGESVVVLREEVPHLHAHGFILPQVFAVEDGEIEDLGETSRSGAGEPVMIEKPTPTVNGRPGSSVFVDPA